MLLHELCAYKTNLNVFKVIGDSQKLREGICKLILSVCQNNIEVLKSVWERSI